MLFHIMVILSSTTIPIYGYLSTADYSILSILCFFIDDLKGLEKKDMGRGQTDTWTSRLLDQSGPRADSVKNLKDGRVFISQNWSIQLN